jgi:hypothetical protein
MPAVRHTVPAHAAATDAGPSRTHREIGPGPPRARPRRCRRSGTRCRRTPRRSTPAHRGRIRNLPRPAGGPERSVDGGPAHGAGARRGDRRRPIEGVSGLGPGPPWARARRALHRARSAEVRPGPGGGGGASSRGRSRSTRAAVADPAKEGWVVWREVVVRCRRDQLESEGYPARRADPCIQSDSSGGRASAAHDTEWVGTGFILQRPPGRRPHSIRSTRRGRSRTIM